jgi:hypothetical protein
MAKAAVLHDWQGVAQNSAKLVAAPSARRGGFFEQEFVDEVDTAAKLADFDIVLSMRERTPTVPPSWLRYGRGKYMRSPEANNDQPPREFSVIQLREAKTEWRRRKPDAPLSDLI